MSSQPTHPTKSPPVVVVPPASEETQSATRALGTHGSSDAPSTRGGSEASSNLRAPTTQSSGTFASLPSPGDSNPRASSSSAVEASSGLYFYTDSSAPVLPISDEVMVARACAEADDRDEGKKGKLKAQRPCYPEVANGSDAILPISDEVMVARACAEADNVLPISDELMLPPLLPLPPPQDEEEGNGGGRNLTAQNNDEPPPPLSSEALPWANPVPAELEASVCAARGQQPEEAVYPTAVEIYGNTNGHDHGLLSRWKRIAGSLGVIFVIAIVLISILIVRNTNGLPSDASNSNFEPLPSMSPTVGLLSSTPKPKLVLSSKPSLFPTANPIVPPSTSPTSIPTALPTEEPTMSPTFTPAPSTMPTFMLPTNCARALLKEVFFLESCGECEVLTAVDGDFAITTAGNFLRPYNLVDGSWKQMQLLTVGTSSSLFPAISGNVVVIGAPGEYENGITGAAYIYERDPISNMWNLATRLAPADLTSGAQFGVSVAVDGDVVVVGAWQDRVGYIGSAYVFRRDGSGGGWSQEAKLAPEDADLVSFGFSVDVKGNTVVVGDVNYGNFEGIAFVYNYNTKSSTWNQFQDNISNDDCDQRFGSSVVLTEDGEIFIGCYGEDSNAGAVYHYAPSNIGGLFEMQQKITASDRSASDYFGSIGQVSVDGNVMVVGAFRANQGQAYVYARDSPSGSWMEVTKIFAPDGETNFGHWVSLSGNKLLVGAGSNAYAFVLERCSDSSS